MLKHGMAGTKIYIVWSNMIQRCCNKKHPSYDNYGKRGIKVCKEWMVFQNFYNDMGASYKEGLSIEREDNELGYFKSNCKWATATDQINNRRALKFSGNSTGVKYIYKTSTGKYDVKLPKRSKKTFSTLHEAKEFIELIKIKGD